MKFSLFYQVQIPRPWDQGTELSRYQQVMEQAEVAEQAGFDGVWLAEHHFQPEISHSGAPDILLAAIAQRTSVLRLGLGVVLLPISHPVRVAERVATLDLVSNGRVEFGTGRSTLRRQLEAFEVDPAETRDRWAEGVELIPRLTAEEEVTFKGRFHSVEGLTVLPKPVQKPHPPMWVACGQPDTYRLAGERGLGAIGFTSGDFEEQRRRVAIYREALKTAKPSAGLINDQIGVWTMAHCAESDREARDLAGPEAMWYFRTIRQQLADEWGDSATTPESYRRYAQGGPASSTVTGHHDEAIDAARYIIGDPDACISMIEKYREAGAQHVLTVMQVGRVPHEKVKRSIELFGKYVIPHFKATARAGIGG